MYEGGALSFDDMTNLPKALRAKLSKVATVGALEVCVCVCGDTGVKTSILSTLSNCGQGKTNRKRLRGAAG